MKAGVVIYPGQHKDIGIQAGQNREGCHDLRIGAFFNVAQQQAGAAPF